MVFEFSVFRFQFSDCGIRRDVFGFDCGYSEENCTGCTPCRPGELPTAFFARGSSQFALRLMNNA